MPFFGRASIVLAFQAIEFVVASCPTQTYRNNEAIYRPLNFDANDSCKWILAPGSARSLSLSSNGATFYLDYNDYINVYECTDINCSGKFGLGMCLPSCAINKQNPIMQVEFLPSKPSLWDYSDFTLVATTKVMVCLSSNCNIVCLGQNSQESCRFCFCNQLN